MSLFLVALALWRWGTVVARNALTLAAADETRRVRSALLRGRRMMRYYGNGSTPFYGTEEALPREALPNILLMVADDMQPRDLGQGYTPHIESIGQRGLSFANAHTPGPLCTPSRYSMLTGRHPSCHFAHKHTNGNGGGGGGGHSGSAPALVQQIGIDGTSALLPDLQPIEFNINLPLRPRANASSRHGGGEAAGAAGGAGGGSAAAVLEDDRAQCTAPTIATLLRERGYATGIFGKWHLGYPAPTVTAHASHAGPTARTRTSEYTYTCPSQAHGAHAVPISLATLCA